jgi:L-aminopeptidase/D-esterase-like protein
VETNVSDLDNLSGMAKKQTTVPVYARLPESDVAEVDKAAEQQKPFAVSRSLMIATIVREWADKRRSPKKR